MDTAGVTQLIAAIFGVGGVGGAIAAGHRAYRASLDRAREEGRTKLIQEQAVGTITTLKEEIATLKEENHKLWALVDAKTS